ncbi:MAG: hypothetical protein QOC98_1964 [Frankiaceae bacterium]|nr:hypothetical protein [Frankiaceae bacterium]
MLAAPKPRRRLNPLRRRRRNAEPAPGGEHEDWDDEYEDDFEDEYDDGYDDGYDDDFEDEYDDGYDDDEPYDDDADDGPYEDDVPTGAPRQRRRRLLPRARRRAADPELTATDAPTAEHSTSDDLAHDDWAHDDDSDATEPIAEPDDQDGGTATPRRRLGGGLGKRRGRSRPAGPRTGRRPRRKVPVAAVRQGAGRRVTSVRTGVSGAGRRVGTGVGRGWAGTRSGVTRGARFVRNHWGRAAYIYLGFVGAALLLTLLLYWHSGFTYDECNSCGIPLLLSVSPWWLLVLPFNLATWPMLLPLAVLVPFAGLNAELIDRYWKRPTPLYPDWD